MRIKQFVDDDGGADLIEYALLAGLISLACVLTITGIGTSLNTLYGQIKAKIPTTLGTP